MDSSKQRDRSTGRRPTTAVAFSRNHEPSARRFPRPPCVRPERRRGGRQRRASAAAFRPAACGIDLQRANATVLAHRSRGRPSGSAYARRIWRAVSGCRRSALARRAASRAPGHRAHGSVRGLTSYFRGRPPSAPPERELRDRGRNAERINRAKTRSCAQASRQAPRIAEYPPFGSRRWRRIPRTRPSRARSSRGETAPFSRAGRHSRRPSGGNPVATARRPPRLPRRHREKCCLRAGRRVGGSAVTRRAASCGRGRPAPGPEHRPRSGFRARPQCAPPEQRQGTAATAAGADRRAHGMSRPAKPAGSPPCHRHFSRGPVPQCRVLGTPSRASVPKPSPNGTAGGLIGVLGQ